METKIKGPVTVEGFVTTDGSFTGFEDEDIAFGATEMFSTATMLVTSSYPRLSFPNGADTSAFMGAFNFPEWYAGTGTDLHIAWTNEGADVTGDVVFAWGIRQVNPETAITAGTLIATGFGTFAPPANGNLRVTQVDLDVQLAAFVPALGYTLGCEIARLGTSPSDTIANAIGLAACGFKHRRP